MGRQIIKQPNGKYCIFSTVVDNVIYYDCTPEKIIEHWTKEAALEIEGKVNNIISGLNNGENPYHQFTMSYDDMIQTIKQNHGVDEAADVVQTIEKQ